MTTIRGAQAIVKCLEREGIELVLGIPGLYNMPIFDALYRHPTIQVVSVRHEQGAAFMADGYARATGKPAAVLTLPGPGLTNAMTGLGEAFYDSSPVLVLSTQVNRDFIDQNRGLLHEMTGQFEMLSPLMKYSERIVDGNDISGVFHRAATALKNGRPRPVQIEIPRDIQVEMVTWSKEAANQEPAQPSPRPAPAVQVGQAAATLVRAERPLIYAGGGVVSGDASAELVRLAQRLGAPVVTTGMGAGAISGDHPLACGVPWIAGGGDIGCLVEACDAFLAVGTRFNQAMTADWSLPLPDTTIRIDVDPDEIERNLSMKQRLVGDVKATLAALDRAVDQLGVDRNAQMPVPLVLARERFRAGIMAKAGKTRPWMEALRETLPRDGIISADMTLFWADMLSAFPVYEPRTMLFPWGFGTLGFGVPVAFGAKLGEPDKPVVAIVGDGAFLFTGAELATAVQLGLPVPILLLNNNAYGMIKVQQRDQYDEQFIGVDLVNPDFVALGRAFGAHATQATTPEALKEALGHALEADRPTLIEVPWGWTWGTER